jgi:hypothetical protein
MSWLRLIWALKITFACVLPGLGNSIIKITIYMPNERARPFIYQHTFRFNVKGISREIGGALIYIHYLMKDWNS